MGARNQRGQPGADSQPGPWRFRTANNINTVKLGFPNGLFVTVPKGDAANLKAKIETTQPLLAPLRTGQSIGTLKLELNGKPYHTLPVVVLEEVPVAGIFGRTWDAIRLYLQ